MEILEKVYQRNQQKLSPEVLKPVTVSTISDLKHVVAEFDPARNPQQIDIPLNTFLEDNEDGKRNVYKVTSKTRSKSKRDMLVEGLTLVQKREEAAIELESAGEITEVNGKPMRPAILNNNTNGRCWIDPLINQWTGGTREGTFIVWELSDGYKYKYDVFEHRLSRIRD